MAHFFTRERSLEDVAKAYVLSRAKTRCISISHAIRAIRTLMPTDATDREIADMIAAAAIDRRISVAFDGINSTNNLTFERAFPQLQRE